MNTTSSKCSDYDVCTQRSGTFCCKITLHFIFES